MPLADNLPKIDDRRYDDIVAEIRTRIARYAPEWRPGESAWTDVNESDPGITLAQVFAWQADMLLYRLNRVPALNYIKFLELIGIQLRPAEPARAEVTLPLKSSHPAPLVIVPARTQLAADPGDGQPPLTFETTQSLVALRAKLDAVLVKEFVDYADVSAQNAAGNKAFRPFGNTAPDGAELALGFNDPAALPDGTLDLAFVIPGDAVDVAFVNCTGSESPRFAPATLRWEYWQGTRWDALKVLKDETLAFSRSGHVRLRLPAAGLAQKTKLLPSQSVPRYWVRAVLAHGQYERVPSLAAVRTNTIAVEQAETIEDEVLGGSDGSRNQQFSLANAPVLADSLTLEIEQSDQGFEAWQATVDFFGSAPGDTVYVLDRTTGRVVFGDGKHGAIPVAYVNNPAANVVARSYRFGGGARGNVAALAIDTLLAPVAGVDDAQVGNLLAAYAGRDEETLDEAKLRAPASLRNRSRAVTSDDFEQLAKEAGNVRRAKALPLYDPRFPGVAVPGVVSVIVVPDGQGPAPLPSEGTLRTVCAYLDARRLLTTELYVLKPHYHTVEIRGRVVAKDSTDLADVSAAVDAALVRYFHPLFGGEDGQGWPFGGRIYYSRVYQQVFAVEGVLSIENLTIALDGLEQPACSDVSIANHGLLSSTSHALTVGYSDDMEGG